MTEMRQDMLRTLDRVVEATLTTAEREAAESGGQSAKLWSALAEQGMTAVGESGSEIGFADALALVERAAFHAAPVPLAETILARRLLSRAGITCPEAALTVVPPQASRASGNLTPAVPFARHVPLVVLAGRDTLELIDTGAVTIHKAHNHAGEPRDTIDAAKARRVASGNLADAERQVMLEGALLRSVQLSGALQRVLSHTLTWVNERVQFGRPISKFQAIQHSLAVMASEVAAARAAVDMALEASTDTPDWLAIAIAKSRAGEAAGKVANASHAAFGAMGFTREHPLHYGTRRLWAWRDEFGSEAVWQEQIGRHVAAAGGAGLWPALTARG